MSLVRVQVVFQDPSEDKSQAEFELVELLAGVGFKVAENEALAVAETAKAAIEIVSPVSGEVREIFLEAGKIYHHGDVLCTIETA